MARRSVLFTPGDRPEMMRGALEGSADVVVFDLEDAVAPDDAEEARSAVDAALDGLPPRDERPEVWVRIGRVTDAAGGPAGPGASDIAAVGDRSDALVVPKVDDVTDLAVVQEAMRDAWADGGDGLPLVPILETASGVLWSRAICATENVTAAVFGAEDLAADLGASRTREGDEVLYGRQKVVAAAAAADVDAIDTLVTDFRDDDRLREDAARSVRWGFDGKLAIHPRQVGVINAAYTPDEERRDWARRVLEAEREAESGVFDVDGEMIDGPLIRRAERIRERARAAGAWSP
jgi:citrate lyase subunit beta/citryl-CoA lyase